MSSLVDWFATLRCCHLPPCASPTGDERSRDGASEDRRRRVETEAVPAADDVVVGAHGDVLRGGTCVTLVVRGETIC